MGRVILLMTSLLLVCPSWASAASLVVFGDSLSDTGNVYGMSTRDPALNTDPPSPPYFQGRMSNGPVWVEHLADRLGVARPVASVEGGLNFAYAGATTGFGFRQRGSIAVPGQIQPVARVGQQIADFLASHQTFAADQTVALWAGANDLLEATLAGPQGGASVVAGSIANMEQHLRTLEAHGARRIIVPNQIDAADAPFWKGFGPPLPDGAQDLLAGFTGSFNAGLESMLVALAADPDFSAQLLRPDMFALLKTVFENPARFGFTNVDEPAFVPGLGEISDADGYLFWDSIHPTTEGHRALADRVRIPGERRRDGSSRPVPVGAADVAVVPAPAALPLFATGLVALALMRCHRLRCPRR